MRLSRMVDWSGSTGCRGKGLSYQAELSSVLQAALSFQASCTLTGSFKELSLSAGYHLELRRGWVGGGGGSRTWTQTHPNVQSQTKVRQKLLSGGRSEAHGGEIGSLAADRSVETEQTNKQRHLFFF